jgi:predicted RNA-binding protein associated with RNAse of E/G family
LKKREYKGDFELKNRFPYFHPGQIILLREIWRGKVWSARPEIVIQDKPDLLALYLAPGTIWKQPAALDGERTKPQNRLRSEWILKEDKWNCHRLRLTIPGAGYSVLVFWDMPDIKHRSWYINMEDPLLRTVRGFDYLDQFLDVIVKPDLSSWRWKDEDELAEAVACGLTPPERAAYLRAEGERVVKWIQSGKSPFNGWQKWRPDPSWKVPVLPEGWDRL